MVLAEDSKDLLRDGLFAEESEGDFETASEKYQALLDGFEKERRVAAVALFRLAEVRRKQGKKKEAEGFYRKLLVEFSGVEPQESMARENLLALGVKPLAVDVPTDEQKELDRLKRLVVTSPDIALGQDLLLGAIKKGRPAVVAFLLTQGADPSGIAWSAKMGNLEICRQLLDAGCDPNIGANSIALENAILKGYWQIVDLLLDRGAKIDVCAPDCLARLIDDGKTEKLEYLIKAGADVNYVDESELRFSDKNRRDTDGKRKRGYYFSTALGEAVDIGNEELVNFLLKNGAIVDLARKDLKITPLHIAVWHQNPVLVKLLIDAGADVNRKAKLPWRDDDDPFADVSLVTAVSRPLCSTLHSADFGGEVFKLLLEAGVELPKDLLMRAVKNGDRELVLDLLKRGMDVNGGDSDERNFTPPLTVALQMRNPEMVRLLREKGAKIHEDDWGSAFASLRCDWYREIRYPIYAKRKGVTLVFPEIDRSIHVLKQLGSANDVAEAFLEIDFPYGATYKGSRWTTLWAQKLAWNRIRGGEIQEVDFGNHGFAASEDNVFSTLQDGDIIEVLGLVRNDNAYESIKWKKLRDIVFFEVSLALKSLIRIPFTLHFDGEIREMTLRGDLVCYDLRSNEMPYVSLRGVINYIRGDFMMRGQSVRVSRSGVPQLTFSWPFDELSAFQLQAGDKVEILKLRKEKGRNSEIMREFATSSVVVMPKNSGPILRYPSHERGERFPTLLQLLADMNAGFSLDYVNSRREKIGLKALSFARNRQEIGKSALAVNSPFAIAPGINLERITVCRGGANGELAGGEELDINLLTEIEKWKAAGGENAPYDLELRAGDLVEIEFKEGPWTGYSELEKDYFESALRVRVFQKMNKDGNLEERVIKYVVPEWIEINGQYVPVNEAGTLQSVRGSRWVGSESARVYRDGEEIIYSDLSHYWPREGDLVVTEGVLQSPPPPGASPLKLTPARRRR